MSSTRGVNSEVRHERDDYKTPHWCIDALAGDLARRRMLYEDGDGLDILDLGAGDGRIGLRVLQEFPRARLTLLDIQFPVELRQAVELRKVCDYFRTMRGDSLLDVRFGEGQVTLWERDFHGWLGPGFGPECGRGPLLIVGNPPFSLVDEFVVRAVENRMQGRFKTDFPNPLAAVAVFLLRYNWLGPKNRASWLNSNPMTRILGLAPRPSFTTNVRIDPITGKKKKTTTDSCEYAWFYWESDQPPLSFNVAVRE